MMEQSAASSKPNARFIGLVYLLYFLVGGPSLLVLRQLVHANDAAATATAIVSNASMYQVGISLDLVANVIYLALTALFYNLLEPVGRRAALLMAFVSLGGCFIQLFGDLFKIVPLVILNDHHLLAAFPLAQVQAAALLSLKLYSQIYSVSLVLFGFYDLLIGWLIVRSTFLPRIIGVLMICAGPCGLIFLWPPLSNKVAQFVPLLAGVPELLLMVWLLVMGVNLEKWQRQTNLTPTELEAI